MLELAPNPLLKRSIAQSAPRNLAIMPRWSRRRYYYKPLPTNRKFSSLTSAALPDASSIPVMLYSVPQFTGGGPGEAPEVGVLAQHPNIIGIKESSGNVQRAAEMLAVVPSAFRAPGGLGQT